MQYSVHPPSPYLCTHGQRLLPTWVHPVASVVVLLQPSNCNLLERSPIAEAQKQLLRQKFLRLGCRVARQLQTMGHLAEVFDPRTGLPLLSQPGSLRLDDVAIAQACLGYAVCDRNGCSVLFHPDWGSAVYPSTLVSSAIPELVEAVLHRECAAGGQNATSLLRAGVS